MFFLICLIFVICFPVVSGFILIFVGCMSVRGESVAAEDAYTKELNRQYWKNTIESMKSTKTPESYVMPADEFNAAVKKIMNQV